MCLHLATAAQTPSGQRTLEQLHDHPALVRLLLKHTKQHTPEGLRFQLGKAYEHHRYSVAAELLLQLELGQHSAVDSISSGLQRPDHDPATTPIAVLKGWASETVDAGHTAAAAQDREVAEQRAGVLELLVGVGAPAGTAAQHVFDGGART